MTDSPEPRKLPEEIQARIDEATAAEAEAKAKKAAADARTAESAAQTQERTADSYDPELAKDEATATSKKNKASADLEAAKARREQLGAFIPDLSKADRGSLTTREGTPPIGGSALNYRAMTSAAAVIVESLALTPAGQAEAGHKPLVLVTTEIDLASLDATHHEVMTGMQELIASIEALPAPTATDRQLESTGAMDLAAGIAGAIPGVLSLLSTRRTVTGAATEANHTAAAAAIAGRLAAQARVVHDAFRPVPQGRVYGRLRELNEVRKQLTTKQLLQGQVMVTLSAAEGALTADAGRFKAEIAKATKEGRPTGDLEAQLRATRAELDWTSNQLATARALLAKMEALAEASDSFSAAVRVATASGRTPLSVAALYEQLREPPAATPEPDPHAETQPSTSRTGQESAPSGAPDRFDFVLFVRAETGETHQSTEDKPFFMKDRFATFAVGVITYLLLDVATGTITAGGTVARSASAHGRFGADIELRG
jgi:hypothetical protein